MFLFCVQKSYSMPIDLDFQKRYATTVLELEQLNKDLNKVLHEVQQYCCEVSEKARLHLNLKYFIAVSDCSMFFFLVSQERVRKQMSKRALC